MDEAEAREPVKTGFVADSADSDSEVPDAMRTGQGTGPILRLALMVLLLGLVGLGKVLGLRANLFREDHPVGTLLALLNGLFKSAGWALSALCWALLLSTRYWRQVKLEENASWRRHAITDAGLWLAATLYWAVWVYFLIDPMGRHFGECQQLPKHNQPLPSPPLTKAECTALGGSWTDLHISGHAFLASLAILLLAEESIRWLTEPACLFTFPPHRIDCAVRRSQRAWYLAMGVSWALIALWMVLYVRTALWYHTAGEKLIGVALGILYYWMVLLARFALR